MRDFLTKGGHKFIKDKITIFIVALHPANTLMIVQNQRRATSLCKLVVSGNLRCTSTQQKDEVEARSYSSFSKVITVENRNTNIS